MNGPATPRRVLHSRSGSVDDTPSGRGRTYPRHLFKATNVWNDIQSTFIEKCPRKRHRRQFTYIEDSFTGKEAVDFLMELIPQKILNGREVGRENCSALLQKFLNQKVFYRHGSKPDAKDQVFKDNYTLYCFPFIPNQVPKLIAEGSNSTLRRTNSVGHVQRKKSLSPIRANSPWSPHRIPDSPGDLKGYNKRLSMSHGNLTQFSMVSSRLSPGIGSFQELSGDKTPTCDRTRLADTPKEEEHEGIYDFLPFRRKKKHVVKEEPTAVAPPPPPPVERPPSLPSLANPPPPQNPPPPSQPPLKMANRMLTEVDLWSVWKTCLLNRLRIVLGAEDLSFLSWNLNGYEIKWNCEKIGSSGIVKSRSDSDDFSAYVMRLMKYLEQFPFHSSSVNVITYRENQEKDVFKTMCSYLERDPSLLTVEEAAAILRILEIYHEKTTAYLGGRQTRAGSHFSVAQQRTPFSRLGESVHRGSISPLSIPSTPMSNYSDLPPAIQLNGLNEQIAFAANGSSHGRRKSIFSPVNRPVSNRERRSLSDSSMDGRGLCLEEALMLPGLKQSPEMLKRISELCVSPQSVSASPDTSFSYKTASSHLSPIVNKLARDEAESLLSAVSLVLLTLPCSRRRRIHHLVRFMNKLCANHCIQLDSERENRYVILESLAHRIVPVDDGLLTPLQALHIVTLLVDHERKVFSVDEQLRKEVHTMVAQIQREKVVQTEEIVLNGTPPTNVVQFCEPVNKEAYQEQNEHKDDFLLPLLDRYINDENMKPSEREKKLKQFQRAHPEVYAKRFPEAPESAKKPTGFLRRVLFKR